MNVLEIIAMVVAALFTFDKVKGWFSKDGVSIAAAKTEEVLEKVADTMDGFALLAAGAGFPRIASVVEEIADIPDELGDVAGKIEEMTANKDFTKERVLELIQEGKEVIVEGKDCYVKVIKKSE